MQTQSDFKKLLRLNKLVPFEDLHPTHQEWLNLKELQDEYKNLNPEFPEKFVIKHWQKVADYLNSMDTWMSYREDLDLWSHFPSYKGDYCHRKINEGYTEIKLEQFENFVKQYPDGHDDYLN